VGSLYRLGRRLGVARGGTKAVSLGIVLGAFPWIVFLALALVEGLGRVFFSIEAIGGQVDLWRSLRVA
jgi:hypothetical protein